jgi:hypothetical protein
MGRRLVISGFARAWVKADEIDGNAYTKLGGERKEDARGWKLSSVSSSLCPLDQASHFDLSASWSAVLELTCGAQIVGMAGCAAQRKSLRKVSICSRACSKKAETSPEP